MKNINNITQAIIDDLQQILEDMARTFNSDQDVHQHTSTLGNKCKRFLQLDQEHEIAEICEDLSFQNIRQSIINIANANDFSNIQALEQVLNTISNHSGIEPETGLNTQELLLRSWHLARGMLSEEMKLYIIDNLHHNIQADGGCLAGITARLILPYCILIINNLQQSLDPTILAGNTVDSNNPEVELSEEQQLELALKASEADALNAAILFSSQQAQEKQTNKLQEEFEVRQAIAASLNTHVQSNKQEAAADAPSITTVWEKVKQATHLDPEEKESIALALALEESKLEESTVLTLDEQEKMNLELALAASERNRIFASSSSSYRYI